MRLILLEWAGEKFGLIDVILELQKKGHEIIYWTSHYFDAEVDRSKFPRTIFHNHPDALRGIPPKNVNDADFSPPTPELLALLSGAESTVLTMMSKLFEKTSVNERKHIYYHYVGYWHGVITKLKPDAIVFPNIPHTVYDFVAYSVARLLGIKTIMFELTRVNDRSLVINDFAAGSRQLKSEIAKNKGKNFALSDLSRDIQEYYNFQTAAAKPIPKDIIEISGRYDGAKSLRVKFRSFQTTITVLKDYSVFAKILTFLPRRLRPNQRNEYLAVQSQSDFSKKFIYAPLQYQPECTTSPLGGVFVDQALMVEILSKSISEDWLIYVKEHPLQWKPRGLDYFSYRYKGYYRNMANLTNVRIVPAGTDGFELIRRSQCVASVGGTAGWEGLFRGKSVLLFGYGWYADAPGVFKIDGVNSCKAALEQIKNGFSVRTQDLINYLASFDKVSTNGFREQYCKDVSTLSLEENIKIHVKVLENALAADEL